MAGTSPTAGAAIGSAEAITSMTDSGIRLVSDDGTNRSSPRSSGAGSSMCPMKRICSATARSAASRSRAGRSGPSPANDQLRRRDVSDAAERAQQPRQVLLAPLRRDGADHRYRMRLARRVVAPEIDADRHVAARGVARAAMSWSRSAATFATAPPPCSAPAPAAASARADGSAARAPQARSHPRRGCGAPAAGTLAIAHSIARQL